MTTNHTDLIRRLYANAQGVELGADGMGWSPDPALYREAADALEAMQPSVREPLSDEQIVSAVVSVMRGRPDEVWKTLTYDSGPYEITKPRTVTVELVRAIEHAHGIGVKGEA